MAAGRQHDGSAVDGIKKFNEPADDRRHEFYNAGLTHSTLLSLFLSLSHSSPLARNNNFNRRYYTGRGVSADSLVFAFPRQFRKRGNGRQFSKLSRHDPGTCSFIREQLTSLRVANLVARSMRNFLAPAVGGGGKKKKKERKKFFHVSLPGVFRLSPASFRWLTRFSWLRVINGHVCYSTSFAGLYRTNSIVLFRGDFHSTRPERETERERERERS